MTTPGPDKLYIAVRADLAPGLQIAQSVHAMAHFADEHRLLFEPWLHDSNWLVVVSVPNEHALLTLATDALGRGIKHTLFREPDLDNEATSVALEAGAAAQRLCASLPLALRQEKTMAA